MAFRSSLAIAVRALGRNRLQTSLPIVGMTILRGLRWDGAQYAGGEVLDPDSGTVYRCRVRVVEGGNKLEVRGFIGVALFGRTQTWLRERRE